jgi:hypothetical protein
MLPSNWVYVTPYVGHVDDPAYRSLAANDRHLAELTDGLLEIVIPFSPRLIAPAKHFCVYPLP